MGADFNILDLYDFENIGDLKVYTNCFNEAMRIQPPVYFSSSVKMMEDVCAGGLNIRKGDGLFISIYHLCNSPKEWIEPEKFIPERFNSGHSHYLTPSGQKRNPYSFSPFLGGQRICLGKTFLEAVSKITMTTWLTQFDISFTEEVNPATFKMPHNNLTVSFEPQVDVYLKPKQSHTYVVQA